MRSAQTLQRIVAADPTLAGWDARRRREAMLTQSVRSALPRQLAVRIRAVDCGQAMVELVADSGAVATAVRQRTPAVLAQLARDGLQFTGIRMRVQVRTEPVPAQKGFTNPIDKASAVPLARLAESLPPGPLRASLRRLLRRAG